jgi:hypothetical protein
MNLICLEIVEEGADNSIIVPIIVDLPWLLGVADEMELYPHN